MRKRISLILALAILFPGLIWAKEMSKAEKIAYLAKPAVVRIISFVQGVVSYRMGNEEKQEKVTVGGMGSGFFINPEGYILTAGHVVDIIKKAKEKPEEVKQKILINFVARKLKEENQKLTMENFKRWVKAHQPQVTKLQPQPTVFLSNYKTFVYEIKKFSPFVTEQGKDVAILKIERDNCPVLFLGDSSSVVVGQDVWLIGYPGSVDLMAQAGVLDLKKTLVQPTLTKGVISAINADYKGLKVIQSDVTASHGNSGGPLVDENVRAIGLLSFGAVEVNPFSGQLQEPKGYEFIIPINTAKEFIRDAGIQFNVASEFTRTYNELLEAYWKGDYFKARDLVAIALSYMRGQPDLQRLQADILRQIQRMPVLKKIWMQHKVLVIVGILIVLLIVGILIVALKAPQTAVPTETVAKPEAPAPQEKPTVLEAQVAGKVEIFVKGSKIGEEVIPPEGAIVGRDPTRARIVVNEPIVSKVHCKIVPQENDTFLVVDLNSTNGTYVGGNKISQEVVRVGDSVQLGKKGDVVLIVKK